MNRQFLAILTLVSVFFAAFQYGASQEKKDESTYPIREHGVGTWYAIDVPLPVKHKIEMPDLTDYKLTLTFDILTHEKKPPEPHLNLAVTAVFKFGGEQLLPPATTHVQLLIDGKATGEFPLKAYAASVGGKERTDSLIAQIPLDDYRALAKATKVEGRLYCRSVDGDEVRQNDLRTFELDEKAIRSLKALDKRAK